MGKSGNFSKSAALSEHSCYAGSKEICENLCYSMRHAQKISYLPKISIYFIPFHHLFLLIHSCVHVRALTCYSFMWMLPWWAWCRGWYQGIFLNFSPILFVLFWEQGLSLNLKLAISAKLVGQEWGSAYPDPPSTTVPGTCHHNCIPSF